MKRKIVSILMAVALITGMLPVSALAEDTGPIMLHISDGDIVITENGYTVGGNETAFTGGYLLTGSTDQYAVTVESGTHTITLDDLHIEFSSGGAPKTPLTVSGDVALELLGNNTLTGESNPNNAQAGSPGIQINEGGSLTIQGDGGLSAAGGWGHHAGNSNAFPGGAGVENHGTFTIAGGHVELTGGDAGNNRGVNNYCADGGMGVGGDLTVTGGTVSVTGGKGGNSNNSQSGSGQGGKAVEGIAISGGVVSLTGGTGGGPTVNSAAGAYAASSVTITGGVLLATGGKHGNNSGQITAAVPKQDAITAESCIVFLQENSGPLTRSGQVYGDAVLDADFTIPADASLTIPESASLTIDSGVTLTNLGTIQNNGGLTNNGAVLGNGLITGDGRFEGEKAQHTAPSLSGGLVSWDPHSVTWELLEAVAGSAVEYGYQTGEEETPGHWQSSPAFSGLTPETPYTFFTHQSETTVYAEALSEPYLLTTAPETNGVTIDYVAETISFDADHYAMNLAQDSSGEDIPSGSSITEAINAQVPLYLRRKADSGDSLASAIPLPQRREMSPDIGSLEIRGESVEGLCDGSVSGLSPDQAYEYQYWGFPTREAAPEWVPVSPGATEITGLGAGWHDIRLAAIQNTAFAGAAEDFYIYDGADPRCQLTVLPSHLFLETAQEQTVTIRNDGNMAVTFPAQPAAINYTVGKLSATEIQPRETASFSIRPKSGKIIPEKITIPAQSNGQEMTVSVWVQKGDTSWYTGHKDAQSYTLTTAAQLAGLSKLTAESFSLFAGKTIRLGADLDLSGYNWQPIFLNGGTFDGGGHAISHVEVTEGVVDPRSGYGRKYYGLFGKISNSTLLCNFTVSGDITASDEDSYIYAGGVAGYSADCVLANVGSSVNVTASGTQYVSAGGILGDAHGSAVLNSYATGEISADASEGDWPSAFAGGLAGSSQNCVLRSGYFGGTVQAKGDNYYSFGGIAGWSNSNAVNCYSKVNGAQSAEESWQFIDGESISDAKTLLSALNNSEEREAIQNGYGIYPLPWHAGEDNWPVHGAPQTILSQPTSRVPVFSVTTDSGKPAYQWMKWTAAEKPDQWSWDEEKGAWHFPNQQNSSPAALRVRITSNNKGEISFQWQRDGNLALSFEIYTDENFWKPASYAETQDGSSNPWMSMKLTELEPNTNYFLKIRCKTGGGWVNFFPDQQSVSFLLWKPIPEQTGPKLTSLEELMGETVRCEAVYSWGEVLTSDSFVITRNPPDIVPSPAPDLPFTDIDGHWGKDSIRWAYEQGLFQGVTPTTFAPDSTMTRGMLATVLYRLAGEPSLEGENLGYPFADVNAEAYYGKAVYWARLEGVAAGTDESHFSPASPITREQLATMLWRYAGSPAATGSLDAFTDGDKASGYAEEALRWAVGEGILAGKGNGILDPKGKSTRAEIAAMLQRFAA